MYRFSFPFFVAFIIISTSALAENFQFYAVDTSKMKRLVCPCEFKESITGVNEGGYGSGNLTLIIAPNEAQPYALINLGHGNIKLEPIGSAKYICKKGELFSPSWKSDDIDVTAKLKVMAPGEEACWFEGSITAKNKNKVNTIRIKGACGC